MPQPRMSAAASRPSAPSTSGPSRPSSRRAFLGLGGAVTLALTGAAAASASPAAAATDLAGPIPAGVADRARRARLRAACPTGLDPAERTSSRATLLRASRAAESVAAAEPGEAPAIAHLSRAEWGADESLRFTAAGAEVWVPTYWPLQTITVHHTADGSTNPDPAARVRSIYRNQAVTSGYGDIGYQFLIDDAGAVYEGRWSGPDGTPGFNADGLMVNGAHVAGYNAGNVGIALLGNFTSVQPSAAAYQALVDLLAVLTDWQGIDPLATVHYVNPVSATKADVPAIPGHRNWAATLCPGDSFVPLLGQLRADVAAR